MSGINGIEVSGGVGVSGGSVSELVASGSGCAAFQVVTNTGERANTGTLAHYTRVMGVTKVALAAGVKALLACAPLAAHKYDAVLEAEAAGIAGGVIDVQLVGDSPGGAGVTIAAVHPHYVIHYESGVSTPALVDAAITGAASFVRVKTASTLLAALATPGDDFVAAPLAGGADGAPGKVVTHGKIRNPAWAWDMTTLPLKPIFLNGNVLSQTDPVIPPGTGFNQQIGVPVNTGAVTSDTIDVDLTTPIKA